jgi:hypothetical protein
MPAHHTVTFQAFVFDDRYSVPTFHLVATPDECAARAVASALLAASVHHRGVELRRDDVQILQLGTCGERRAG